MAAATTRRPSAPVLSAAHYRSASPARIKLSGAGARYSPAGQSVSVSSPSPAAGARARRICMCSPTNHPGSFRCSLHRERKPTSPPSGAGPTTSRLDAGAGAGRRMGSALARIGAVEGGECARRALAATVRPSPAAQQSQHRRRVARVRPGPSRLSAVSMAGDRPGDNGQW
ncbi:hypothetical protein BS78_04G308300 [Paspalum vaginatum]|nr:hypothetical protein BS78_04G308300 [Paspalum vaginatum]